MLYKDFVYMVAVFIKHSGGMATTEQISKCVETETGTASQPYLLPFLFQMCEDDLLMSETVGQVRLAAPYSKYRLCTGRSEPSVGFRVLRHLVPANIKRAPT